MLHQKVILWTRRKLKNLMRDFRIRKSYEKHTKNLLDRIKQV